MSFSYYINLIRQAFFIPSPSLTERNLPDQTGKVSVITGGYAGVGYELSKILYAHNGTVYIAGRSSEKATRAINSIKQDVGPSKGKLEFLQLDLADLRTIKSSAEEFLGKEDRLDVLVNNAGVMMPPKGSKDALGHEIQMGTNCLGHFLFTRLLYPVIQNTAAASALNTVRVLWAGSSAIDLASPRGGVDLAENGVPKDLGSPQLNYGQSKTGNLLYATEYTRRYPRDGVVHLGFNPGNLRTELGRHLPKIIVYLIKFTLAYPAIYGAYTELWAGWSADVSTDDSGKFVVPWGRFAEYRADIVSSTRLPEEGGTGKAAKFWEWCEAETGQYA